MGVGEGETRTWRSPLTHFHHQRSTASPPHTPPAFLCPCGQTVHRWSAEAVRGQHWKTSQTRKHKTEIWSVWCGREIALEVVPGGQQGWGGTDREFSWTRGSTRTKGFFRVQATSYSQGSLHPSGRCFLQPSSRRNNTKHQNEGIAQLVLCKLLVLTAQRSRTEVQPCR